MINVTKPELPDRELFNKYLDEIWKTHWLTNNGTFVQELEKRLVNFLGVSDVALVNNGTSGLLLALKVLGLEGEIITTPLTFVATTNAILWNGLKPVFADIDPDTFNIDPADVERKITNKTTAILAVHIYGNPCDVDALAKIAKKHKLKLIFDAAHAFGVEYKNRSVLNYGDVSVLSFHATKTFNTIEGGALIARKKKILKELSLYRNFGIQSDEKIIRPGINAKMNEFQAIMGLCNLENIQKNILDRKKIFRIYKDALGKSDKVVFQKICASKYNYSYMPVVFKTEKQRNVTQKKLYENGYYAKKYFYPLTSNLVYTYKMSNNMKLINAERISRTILCLPMYPNLEISHVDKIISIIKSNL